MRGLLRAAMSATFSSTENTIAFGFNRTDIWWKTANPKNVTTDWCHYLYSYATRFPNYVRLGDNKDFIIIGVNAFQPSFVGADITAISKPPPGTARPAPESFKKGTAFSVRNIGRVLVATPVPSNQIDDLDTGYVLATAAWCGASINIPVCSTRRPCPGRHAGGHGFSQCSLDHQANSRARPPNTSRCMKSIG
jgi:hypothetical protein